MTITLYEHADNQRIDAIHDGHIIMTAHHRGHANWTIHDIDGQQICYAKGRPRAKRILLGEPDPGLDPDTTLALTIPCRICDAKPARRCIGLGVGGNTKEVHIGRLKDVLPAPRDEQHAWLDWHDQYLADPQAPARHRQEIYTFAGLMKVEVTRERRTQ